MAYAVTKAAGWTLPIVMDVAFTNVLHQGLHLVKCLASTQGPKVRVNAILPGLLLTEWVRLHGGPCVLSTNADLGRQIHAGHASSK